MPEAHDSTLGRLAVEQGLITPEQLAECLRARGGSASDAEAETQLGNVLTEKRYLSPEQVASLLGAHERCGKYLLVREIGRGGMGVVYRAWDAALGRTVALKVLATGRAARPTPTGATESDEELQRFLREAKTLAKLSHPNIVPIYDVGEADGCHFLAMEFIGGGSLREAMTDLAAPTPRRKPRDLVRWIAEVCRGVQHAHDHGIVHRDLKPENILLKREARELGEVFVPVVADFGLAHAHDSTSNLTRTGQVLGTPSYMSPEQCESTRAIDGRSDIFSLGTILYEIVTGRKPFEGDNSMATLFAIAGRDPDSPRKFSPHLHPDLETVILKALEKPTDRRYASARELGEELERVLDGEPIHARPISTASRILRRAVRHRLALGAVSLALALGLGGAWAVAHVRRGAEVERRLAEARPLRQLNRAAEARDAFAQVLALDADDAEARDGFAWADAAVRREREQAVAEKNAAEEALRKGGLVQEVLARWNRLTETLAKMETIFYDSTLDAGGKRAQGEALWGPVEDFLRATPADACSQSAARALAGWARRLAGHPEEGLAWMREARRLDPDLPYGALMEALAWFSDYVAAQELPEITIVGAGLMLGDAPAESAGMREWRTRTEALLTDAGRARVWGSGAAERLRRALEAVRAYQGGKYADAERTFSEIVDAEALQVFRTDLLFARGKVRYVLLRFDESLVDFESVVRARPEQAAAHFYRGEVHAGAAVGARRRGEDPVAHLDKAIAEFGEALRRQPDHLHATTNRGVAYLTRGEDERAQGRDPEEWYRKAQTDFETAIRIDATWPYAYDDLGFVEYSRGEALAARGEDPRERFTKAIAWFEEAFQRARAASVGLNNRAHAYWKRGEAAAARGEDPSADCRLAIADFDMLAAAHPDMLGYASNRAEVRETMGQAEDARGGDGRPTLDQAIADLDDVVRRDPQGSESIGSRGLARLRRGRAGATHGEDPRATFELAIADFAAAAKLGPARSDPCFNLGQACGWRAQAETRRSGDPRPWYRQAVAAFDEALRRSPDRLDARLERGHARMRLAEDDTAHGEDARETLARAIEDFDEVLRQNPAHIVARRERGTALRRLGEAVSASGQDPRDPFRRALADFDALPGASLDQPNVRSLRAGAAFFLAEAEAARGEDPRPEYERAIADYTALLEKDGDNRAALTDRAFVFQKLGMAQVNRGGDPAPAYARSIEAYDAALARGAVDAASWLHRADTYSLQGDWEKQGGRDPHASWEHGLTDYAAALAQRPDLWLAAARAGDLLERLGRFDEAIAQYEAALKIKPGVEQVQKLLERARKRAGK